MKNAGLLMSRYDASFPPPLNSTGIAVPQASSKGAYASKLNNDVSNHHANNVRTMRIIVNVACIGRIAR